MLRHGLNNHPLYKKWLGIKRRCYNVKDRAYKHYGGRGISMCEEWKNDFKSFYDWCIANDFSKGLEIDRRDNDGKYEPSNCRFITRLLNAKNKRSNRVVSFDGETMILTDWAIKLNIPYDTLRYRIKAKWPIAKAFNQSA